MTHHMNTPRAALEEKTVSDMFLHAVLASGHDREMGMMARELLEYRTHGKALSEALGGWLPIETAPKDGTPVDLCCGRYEERLVNYSRHEPDPGNVYYEPNEGGRCVVRTASHWRPLPPPPTSANGEKT